MADLVVEGTPHQCHVEEISGSANDVFSISDLVIAIARNLSHNFIACGLRLVNRTTAAALRDYTVVRLSERVPKHAFATFFGSPGSLRSFNRTERLKLVTLTAVSGSLKNLKRILSVTASYLTSEDQCADVTCIQPESAWNALSRHGYDEKQLQCILESAAAAGHRKLCIWLLSHGCPGDALTAACAAARAGHVDLMRDLWQSYTAGDRFDGHSTLTAAVAEGCDLETLKGFVFDKTDYGPLPCGPISVPDYVTCAAISHTADWREKTTFMVRCGFQCSSFTAERAARLPDAAERLAWLRSQGYSLDLVSLESAARRGTTSALHYLLDIRDWGGRPSSSEKPKLSVKLTTAAAEGGQLTALQLLHARGCDVSVINARLAAVRGGHLDVLAWLAETFPAAEGQLRDPAYEGEMRGLSHEAVRTGSLRLVRWMHERGDFCPQEQMVEDAVRRGGSEEMVEWLVERGCPVQVDVCRVGLSALHPAMRRCLQRLGWQPELQPTVGVAVSLPPTIAKRLGYEPTAPLQDAGPSVCQPPAGASTAHVKMEHQWQAP